MKNFDMKKFLLNLQFIFRPRFWHSLLEFNKNWDEDLNYLIDHVPAKLDRRNSLDGKHYNIVFGEDENSIYVWIMNYPYSYGNPYKVGKYRHEYRPSKLTILKLRKLEKKLKKEYEAA